MKNPCRYLYLSKILILSVILLSCEFFKPGEPVEFTTITDYSQMDYPQRANFIFQDSATLRAFWKSNSYDTTNIRPPRVNFNDATIICVFMGCRPHNDRAEIEEIRHFDNEVVVYIKETSNPSDLDMVIFHSHVVTILKTSLPINFEYREKVD